MLKLKIVKWQGCVLWGKKGQEGNVQQRAGQGRCDVDPTAEMLAVLVTGGKEGVGLGAGLAARVGHPSSSCLRSGFLFGELADDTNERSVLILQPLIVRLQLRQNLRKDKDEAGLQLGGMAKKKTLQLRGKPAGTAWPARLVSCSHLQLSSWCRAQHRGVATGPAGWLSDTEHSKARAGSGAPAPALSRHPAGGAGTISELFQPKPAPKGQLGLGRKL